MICTVRQGRIIKEGGLQGTGIGRHQIRRHRDK